VSTGNEDKTVLQIEKILPPEAYDQCFSLTRRMRKKIHGKWKDIRERLLPGYVFVRTEDVGLLYEALRTVPALTRLLGRSGGTENDYFTALSDRDVRWLSKLTGNVNAINPEVALSQVQFDQNDEIRIISGPLADMTGMIKRINLHRRCAEVEVEFMNQKSVVFLGIELLEKTE